MVSKLSVVEEEADEGAFWLEVISDAELMPVAKTQGLLQEAGELTAIMVASRKTILANNRKSRFENRKSTHS